MLVAERQPFSMQGQWCQKSCNGLIQSFASAGTSHWKCQFWGCQKWCSYNKYPWWCISNARKQELRNQSGSFFTLQWLIFALWRLQGQIFPKSVIFFLILYMVWNTLEETVEKFSPKYKRMEDKGVNLTKSKIQKNKEKCFLFFPCCWGG